MIFYWHDSDQNLGRSLICIWMVCQNGEHVISFTTPKQAVVAPNFTGYLKELRVWNSIHNNYYLMFLNKVHRYHRQSEAYLFDYMRFTTIRADASDVL